jgi:hypothetical protein
MSTFSKTYLHLMQNNPSEKSALKHLAELYQECKGNSKALFALPIFLDKLSLASSPSSFLTIMFLEDKGLIKKVVRVESPKLGGIGDYASLSDVPEVVTDFRTGLDFVVTSESIQVLYSLTDSIEVFE